MFYLQNYIRIRYRLRNSLAVIAVFRYHFKERIRGGGGILAKKEEQGGGVGAEDTPAPVH